MTSTTPQNNIPPHIKVTDFQKVIIIQALRPDRLHSSMKNCVINITGLKSLEAPMLDLFSIYNESNNSEPILILAVAGADPISQIVELSQRLNIKYMEVNIKRFTWRSN